MRAEHLTEVRGVDPLGVGAVVGAKAGRGPDAIKGICMLGAEMLVAVSPIISAWSYFQLPTPC